MPDLSLQAGEPGRIAGDLGIERPDRHPLLIAFDVRKLVEAQDLRDARDFREGLAEILYELQGVGPIDPLLSLVHDAHDEEIEQAEDIPHLLEEDDLRVIFWARRYPRRGQRPGSSSRRRRTP